MNWFLVVLLVYLAAGAIYGVYNISTQGAGAVGFTGFFSYLLGWPVYVVNNLSSPGSTINS